MPKVNQCINVPPLNPKRKHFPKCLNCGRINHASSKCFYVDAKCMNCGKSGHISTICHSKSNQYKKNPKQINTVDNDSSDLDKEVPISVLTSVNSVSLIYIYVFPVIYGNDFWMEPFLCFPNRVMANTFQM